MQARASEDLTRPDRATSWPRPGSPFDEARGYATPRRLALIVDGIAARSSPTRSEERQGPRVGAPAAGARGLPARRRPRHASMQCEERDTGRASSSSRSSSAAGRPTAEVLPELLPAAIAELPWPKSMRWAGRVVALGAAAASASSACSTARSLAAAARPACRVGAHDAAAIAFWRRARSRSRGFDDYQAKLHAAHVMLDRRTGGAIDRRQARHAWPRPRALTVKPDDGAARRSDRAGRMAGRADGPDRRASHGRCRRRCWRPRCARTRNISRCSTTTAGWRRASWSSPTSRPATAARRSSPATSGCCGPASPTPVLLGPGPQGPARRPRRRR